MEPLSCSPYILAGGAAFTLLAVFLGTSRQPTLRVGDPGIAEERGGAVARIRWYDVASVRFENGAVVIDGKNDEGGAPLTIRASLKTQAHAAAWIVKEARARIPSLVSVNDADVGEASATAGELVRAESLQVVGMRCSASGKIVAFQPDARVCGRCERVYHKDAMPEECLCGATLSHDQKAFENDSD